MSVELISFRLCPFVQRSVITLLEKGVEHTMTYIDLAEPPQWFLDISPFGKVPVLRQGGKVVFESAVINEYLDEVNPPPLHPVDPLEKAVNRAWIEFGSDLIMKQYGLSIAADEDTFEEGLHQVGRSLAQLEQYLALQDSEGVRDGPWFNGARYSLVDTAFAPLFQRFALLEQWSAQGLLEETPRVADWHSNLVARPSTAQAVAPTFAEEWRAYIAATKGYGASVYGGL